MKVKWGILKSDSFQWDRDQGLLGVGGEGGSMEMPLGKLLLHMLIKK